MTIAMTVPNSQSVVTVDLLYIPCFFYYNQIKYLFLYLQEIIEVTGTFKQQKFKLVEEGFNPTAISDPLYFLDNSKKSYVLLTKELYEKIVSGQVKL